MLRRPIAVVTLSLLLASPAAAATSASSLTNPETPVPVQASDAPPVGRFLSADRVLEIAGRLPKLRSARAEYPGSYAGAYLKGTNRWQVSYFSRAGKEIGQAIVADRTGRVLEQWTGFQIAWTMARGYRGAFGRHVNALYVWIPLCVLFFVPFFDWRHPLRLLHLDLLVLLSFSVSLAFFNHGRIDVSTPLAYPPLLYLLVRMLVLGRVRLRRARRPPAPERPAALLIGTPWLAIALLFLVGFRVALNVTDSNVIDVGYAGVIGAQRMVQGKSLYGGYPSDNEHGDTYGPFNYAAYVPFEQALGFSGHWDDLPAAHGAAICFDLLTIALLFWLGLRIRGPSMGIALAYAWAAYPFTLFTLESNSNDTLVAVLLLAVLLVASSAPVRGVFAALAGLAKFAPLALAPLFASHRLRGAPRARQARDLALYVLAFGATVALAAVLVLGHDSLHTVYERTLVYQSKRESPFSIWGLYGASPTGGPAAHWLSSVQSAVELAAGLLALALALLPRREDLVGLAACATAILIAVQLGIDHWFYLYIPWFFGLAMVALLGQLSWAPAPPRSSQRAASDGASGSARSSRLAVA
ncbi:MAG TPA: hypothetical protein VHU13_03355 [Solirubrobacteraceae bacterium]|jgi:hypothetical protein|nr:hypothetical protein [Solirubrobacteraceae bacterium]